MKAQTRSILFSAALLLFVTAACNNKAKNTDSATDTAITDGTATEAVNNDAKSDTDTVAFDINTIPVTTKELGTFPYLKAPAEYKFNDITKSDLETVHFPVDGVLMALEGKTFSTNIYKLQESDTPFNMQIVQKDFDKKIGELGGVKVSSRLLPGQVEKIGKKVMEEEGDHAYTIIGTNDYTLNHVNTYVIRTAEAQIWVELSFYQNGGYVYILEKANL